MRQYMSGLLRDGTCERSPLNLRMQNMNSKQRIRVLLVDDHAMVRQGLNLLLGKRTDMEVVGEAEDGATAIRLALELKPDVIIMDVSMPGMTGIDAARRILPAMPDAKLIAVSAYLRKAVITEMLKAGASGYVLKEQAADELMRAIKAVMAGETYLSTKTVEVIVDDFTRSQGRKHTPAVTPLTERERRILRLSVEGKSSEEIAMIVDASVKEVDASRRRTMQKLEVDSLAELIECAIDELTSRDF